jgi:HlyD family secretion protein
MKNQFIFGAAVAGVLLALTGAYLFSIEKKAQPPVFDPATNPYEHGIYANGIVESYQSNGEDINIYPEVSGRITQILVREGDNVKAGAPLIQLDASVQRGLAEQQGHQAEAALATLQELKAEPRKENLDVAKAQVTVAEAGRQTASDEYEKQKHSYDVNPKSVSKDALDNARNALKSADANLEMARRQYALTKAGAWTYDIENQQKQYNALVQAYQSSSALLDKYTIRATADGIVLAINTSTGSYISTQGAYDTYTQGFDPIVVMGGSQTYLAVRCYIDEILVDRLPSPARIRAQMSIRGTNVKIPLEFVRVQPYVSPKIELSDQRQERVDLRVLPVIFRFKNPGTTPIYPGELVDVYVGEK